MKKREMRMDESLKEELLKLIKRHWKKAAWGAVIFFIIRFLLVAFFGWWILSTVLERRQEFKESSEAFEADFQEKSESFKKDFNDTRASIKAKQNELKEEFENSKAIFGKSFGEK